MSTLMSRPPQKFVMEDVSWAYYDRTLRERDARGSHLRVTYDDGRMELVTTGSRHEQVKKAIARLLEMYSVEMDIPITGLGEVTCRLKRIRKGLEPDECYYITSPVPSMSDKGLDLSKYPPPDLAVEVDITSLSIPRQPIYAALGVPEIWRYRGGEVAVLIRGEAGKYQPAERSLAFPGLPMKQFNRFLKMALTRSQHEAAKALRDWVRQQTK